MFFLDMKSPYLELKTELDAAYRKFMESGNYVLSNELSGFENSFADFCGCTDCAGVSNGLDALSLALEAAGITAGDEVIVPANTYIATFLAVTHLGAVPVPVEMEEERMNIDPAMIPAAITAKTKAIIAVHLYGIPAKMNEIMAVAAKYNLFVLEDNAQAHGAIYNNKRTGNLADAAAVSFYPGKNLGAFGEAGAVCSNNNALIERVKLLRNYGSKEKYHNIAAGYNRRMDDLQAAFLSVKLKYIDEWNNRRRKIAAQYFTGLAGIPNLQLLPITTEQSVFHQFIIRVPERNTIKEMLSAQGIPTMVHYPIPAYLQPAYANLNYRKGDFPITEKWAESMLSLPIGPHQKDEDTEMVILALRNLLNSRTTTNLK